MCGMKILLTGVKDEMCNFLDNCTFYKSWFMLPLTQRRHTQKRNILFGECFLQWVQVLCHVHQSNTGNLAGTEQDWACTDVPRANDFSTWCFLVQGKVKPKGPIKPGYQTLENGNPDLFLLIMENLLFNLTDLF